MSDLGIKRYEKGGDHCGPLCDMDPADDGDWVAYEEHAAALAKRDAEIKRLQEALDNAEARGIHTCSDQCQRIECVQRREIERLRGEVDRFLASHTRRWNVEEDLSGNIRLCRGEHESSASCDWESFEPAYRIEAERQRARLPDHMRGWLKALRDEMTKEGRWGSVNTLESVIAAVEQGEQ